MTVERDDLRVATLAPERRWEHRYNYRQPTDDEFDAIARSLGYVRVTDENGEPRDGVEVVDRPTRHHVTIEPHFFTVNHPMMCDLKCGLYERCSEAWDGPPAPPGEYRLDPESLTLHPPVSGQAGYFIPAEMLENSRPQRHMEHYRSCGCLDDSSTCCDPTCCEEADDE